jgi:hypothetical protein
MIKSKIMRWNIHVAHMEDMLNTYKFLIEKPEGKKPLCRSSGRQVDNVKMALKYILCEGVNWIYLSQYMDQWRTVVGTVLNLRFP